MDLLLKHWDTVRGARCGRLVVPDWIVESASDCDKQAGSTQVKNDCEPLVLTLRREDGLEALAVFCCRLKFTDRDVDSETGCVVEQHEPVAVHWFSGNEEKVTARFFVEGICEVDCPVCDRICCKCDPVQRADRLRKECFVELENRTRLNSPPQPLAPAVAEASEENETVVVLEPVPMAYTKVCCLIC